MPDPEYPPDTPEQAAKAREEGQTVALDDKRVQIVGYDEPITIAGVRYVPETEVDQRLDEMDVLCAKIRSLEAELTAIPEIESGHSYDAHRARVLDYDTDDQALLSECAHYGLPLSLRALLRHIYGNYAVTMGAKDFSIRSLESKVPDADL